MSVTTVVLLAWSGGVVVFDLFERRIPNLLSLGAFVVALLVLLVQGRSATGDAVASALLAAGLGVLLTLPAYLGGALGAGDVKLAVALGLLSDLTFLIVSFGVAALLAGVWAGGCLLGRRAPWLTVWLPDAAWIRRLTMPGKSGKPVPFGAALGVGFAVSLALPELPTLM